MGADFAARRRLFDRAGYFDEMLGGGGPLWSSQDYDFAYRTYKAGGVILLRPEVYVRHDGRREDEEPIVGETGDRRVHEDPAALVGEDRVDDPA